MMKALKTDFPFASRYVSNEMAAWLAHGETLGRVWNICRGRFQG